MSDAGTGTKAAELPPLCGDVDRLIVWMIRFTVVLVGVVALAFAARSDVPRLPGFLEPVGLGFALFVMFDGPVWLFLAALALGIVALHRPLPMLRKLGIVAILLLATAAAVALYSS